MTNRTCLPRWNTWRCLYRDGNGYTPSIRRRVWVGFYNHEFVIELNLVSSGFVSLILLNSDLIPVVIKPKLK
jgi:hypothetical protein